jgi:transcriptional regulator with XRE-family HTH domain
MPSATRINYLPGNGACFSPVLSLEPMSTAHLQPVGNLLRGWRERRRLSQLALACDAEISTRHLSFVETGRSLPSREMILHLAERLDIPLRERNALLISAGYAPVFPERPLVAPELEPARKAVDLVLKAHSPYPAIAIDGHWTLIAANSAAGFLMDEVDPSLLASPVNVLRLTLHPAGIASAIANYFEWRSHLFMRLRRQIDATADPVLQDLLNELQGYPAPDGAEPQASSGFVDYGGVVSPLRLATKHGVLTLFGTTTIFGTPLDITLSELAIEAFFPGDSATSEILLRISREGSGST